MGRGIANFWASAWRRSTNSVTRLPGSAAARRTWGRGHPGRVGSRRRPRSYGPEGPRGTTRGSWAIGTAWALSRLSVRPSVCPGTGPTHQSVSEKDLYRPAPPPSARRDPHYCFRAASAQTASRSAPPRPPAPPRAAHGESGGTSPQPRGPHVVTQPRGVQPPSSRPRSPRAPVRTPHPTPRLRGEHLAPLRVAHMDPSGPPPSSPCKLQPLAGCRSGPTATAG